MVEREIHLYGDLNRDGFTVFYRGRKFPLLYSIHCRAIKIGTERLRDGDIAWHAIGTDNQL